MVNYYRILGIADFSTTQEIKKTYRKLSLKLHPDQNQNDKFFEEKFKELKNAYDTLSNINGKRIHDENLRKSYRADTNPFNEKATYQETEVEEESTKDEPNNIPSDGKQQKSFRKNVFKIAAGIILFIGFGYLIFSFIKSTKIPAAQTSLNPNEVNERDSGNIFIRYNPSKLTKKSDTNNLAVKKQSFFKIGSSKSEVFEAQGAATRIDVFSSTKNETWYYELSSITFINNKVVDFSNKSGNLKISR